MKLCFYGDEYCLYTRKYRCWQNDKFEYKYPLTMVGKMPYDVENILEII